MCMTICNDFCIYAWMRKRDTWNENMWQNNVCDEICNEIWSIVIILMLTICSRFPRLKIYKYKKLDIVFCSRHKNKLYTPK